MAVSCGTVIAGISFEEGIPAFRRGVDAWRAESGMTVTRACSRFEARKKSFYA